MSNQQTIEQRLASLERSARRWRIAFAVLMIGVVGAFIVGAAKKPDEPKDLAVSQLRVVDEAGKTLVLLHGGKEGGAVQVFGRTGDGNGMLSGDANGSAVVLADGNNTDRMFISVSSEKGGTGIQILDAEKKTIWSTGQKRP